MLVDVGCVLEEGDREKKTVNKKQLQKSANFSASFAWFCISAFLLKFPNFFEYFLILLKTFPKELCTGILATPCGGRGPTLPFPFKIFFRCQKVGCRPTPPPGGGGQPPHQALTLIAGQ